MDPFLYSVEPMASKIAAGFQSGALGYFEFPFDGEEVLQDIRNTLSQQEKEIRRRRLRVEARALLRNLSPRERQVAFELSTGSSNKQIARALNLSPRTVEIHRSNMIHKLSARNSAEAIRLLVAAG